MYSRANKLIEVGFLLSASHRFLLLSKYYLSKPPLSSTPTSYSTFCLDNGGRFSEASIDHSEKSIEVLNEWGCTQLHLETVVEEAQGNSQDSLQVFRQWGCSDNDISKILSRRPALRNADVQQLQSKLALLSGLGLTSFDLVKIIHCRPRFLSGHINHCFDERIEFFMTLFGSKEVLRKAIVRNPSLLTYDLHGSIRPIISQYERIGINREDFIQMLLSRPTLIPRTSFNDAKMEYIKKTGVSKDSKMFKYVVTIIGISRLETIFEKVTNLEKFGFSNDEVWGLFGRSPLLLTLSVEKIQRNMTYILGTIKFPANVVLEHSFLLFSNLEDVLKPRLLVARKIQDMDLHLDMNQAVMIRALRMQEKRFLKAFVLCHPEDISRELMEFYSNAKDVKRLAEASKKIVHKGFPF